MSLRRLISLTFAVLLLILFLHPAFSGPCPTCGGDGLCPQCGGSGISGYTRIHGQPAAYGCETCRGRRGNPRVGGGYPGSGKCPSCGGSGGTRPPSNEGAGISGWGNVDGSVDKGFKSIGDTSYTLYIKGKSAMDKGDYAAAVQYLDAALRLDPNDVDIRTKLQTARELVKSSTSGLNLKDINNLKAVKEAQSNLYHTGKEAPGAVFDNKATKAPRSSLPAVAPIAGQPVPMSERVRNDQRMIKAQKRLEDLQTKRQEIDEKRTELAKERNSTTDPEEMKQFTKELDKLEKDYQRNLLAVSKQTEKIERLKRNIDAEVQGSGGQTQK